MQRFRKRADSDSLLQSSSEPSWRIRSLRKRHRPWPPRQPPSLSRFARRTRRRPSTPPLRVERSSSAIQRWLSFKLYGAMDSVQGFDHTLALASCRRRMSTSCHELQRLRPDHAVRGARQPPRWLRHADRRNGVTTTATEKLHRGHPEHRDARSLPRLPTPCLAHFALQSSHICRPTTPALPRCSNAATPRSDKSSRTGRIRSSSLPTGQPSLAINTTGSVAMASTSARPAPTRRVTTSRARSHFSRFSPAHSPPMPASEPINPCPEPRCARSRHRSRVPLPNRRARTGRRLPAVVGRLEFMARCTMVGAVSRRRLAPPSSAL